MAQFIQLTGQDDQRVRAELLAGLTAREAQTSPKYLYDGLGSRLFEAICELPEYYPTRTEASILSRFGKEIAAAIAADQDGEAVTLIDLGAGNCAKGARLLPLLRPAQYVPIDISVDFLREAVSRLQPRCPDLDIAAIGMDFSAALELPEQVRKERRLFFYPGSSLGNFTPSEARDFLHGLRLSCNVDGQPQGGVLIGIDLVKDAHILDAAYDDALGVTACFNLNVLRNLNAVIGSDFDMRQWTHRGFFNSAASRIEMHLEARENLTVHWDGGRRRFERGERIHTENSYKYTPQSFRALLAETGFGAMQSWTDSSGWFMVCYARAI